MDFLLQPYLSATGEATEKLLEDLLVREAEPRIRKVILRKLGPDCPDLDDICADVLLEATQRLRGWKALGSDCRVESFANYIASCSFNAASEYLRRKYPRWRRLRDRIHYVLRHDARLALWESAHSGWLCGLAGWRGQESPAPLGPRDRWTEARGLQPADSLHAVFQTAGQAMDLDALVDLAADLWGVELDAAPISQNPPSTTASNVEDEIDQRRYAERLWREILELPLRQRQALLLHMKADGLDVFLLFGVVSFRSLANALGLGLGEFADLCRKLPLEDLAIAERLHATRQQVINLRKSARKRLAGRNLGNIEDDYASSKTGTG